MPYIWLLHLKSLQAYFYFLFFYPTSSIHTNRHHIWTIQRKLTLVYKLHSHPVVCTSHKQCKQPLPLHKRPAFHIDIAQLSTTTNKHHTTRNSFTQLKATQTQFSLQFGESISAFTSLPPSAIIQHLQTLYRQLSDRSLCFICHASPSTVTHLIVDCPNQASFRKQHASQIQQLSRDAVFLKWQSLSNRDDDDPFR